MKKYLLIFSLVSASICQLSFAQNVGIGTVNPLSALHIKKDLEALRIEGTSSYISFYNSGGTVPKVFMQNGGDNLYLGTSTGNSAGLLQFYMNSVPQMTLTPNGNFGIGTAAPDYRLNVNSNIVAGNTNTNLLKLSGQNPLMAFSNGTTDFGYIKAWTSQAFAPFTNGLVIGGSPGYPIFFSTNNYGASMTVADNGNVGIGITTPANRLQIGSLGNTGYAGHDIAIGNGSQVLGISQSNVASTFTSTTDIILTPRGNGAGRVGINTTTPRAPLDVVNDLTVPIPGVGGAYAYYTLAFSNFTPVEREGGLTASSAPNVSIIASNRVLATEFDAYSDARIKNIIGVSNTSKDLQIINKLKITDYSFKDKLKYGDKPSKKVIAQEVEEVYPQVVSKHTDFIPNVYQLTSKVQKVVRGYMLHFDKNHNLTKAAKKLQLIISDKDVMQQFDIIDIPNNEDVIISATNLGNDKVFVYGEEVNDFRTVDYEGLTTLNISATQELSKLVKKQQEAIDAQNKQIAELTEAIKTLQKERHASYASTSN